MRNLILFALASLSLLACRPAVSWPHHCRACSKRLEVGPPRDPSYRPICTACWARGD